jgi:23S rRNA (guanosine2251-2'-O)-methyltransferase
MAKKQKPHERQFLPAKPSARPAQTSSYNSRGPRERSPQTAGNWVYGWHAVGAALANPERTILRIVATEANARALDLTKRRLPTPHIMETRDIDRLVGAESVHQGIAAEVRPLEPYVLEDILHIENPRGPIIILDQVSDPHNVGAIMRSAAAYDAIAVITPKDHSAPETPTMAKAASGGLDIVPRITVTNLAAAMRELKDAGYWIVGLEGEATKLLTELTFAAKTVIVLGAEGKGMRRLTADLCDERARLPMGERMESLNVSNAAAIALYHLYVSKHHAG